MDTIAAIATPLGVGALGIVRLSGAKAISIAGEFVESAPALDAAPTRQAVVARVRDQRLGAGGQGPAMDDSTIDSAIVIKYVAPASFTGEDMVEITAHGSPVILRRILALALRSGAREALPGEFTQRAFLNGKLDLAQAQAVCGMIRAQSDLAARLELRIVSGQLTRRLNQVLGSLAEGAALADLLVDHPDEPEIAPQSSPQHLARSLEEIVRELNRLRSGFESAQKIREGFVAAIIGAPNAGKSTLFNAILLKDRAIVTPEAGTTRDTLEEFININGRLVRLIDTAGLRQPLGEAESFGIRRTHEAIKEADFCLWVIDGAKGPLTSSEKAIENEINAQGKPYALIWNKSDLPAFRVGVNDQRSPLACGSLTTSAGDPLSLDDLRRLVARAMESLFPWPSEVTVTEERHAAFLDCAMADARRAQEHLKLERWELLGLELRHAMSDGHAILGQGDVSEEILRSIFSKFCVGK
ncbi:MAG: tRNA uridine-5-carboxymethylaminomethyl(34) synthesis GTPase MnmE [Elusimicrobia bacterium]|nr:tRNA uridine-5-carboxymethylaminomethyl(34) synthesis GTPase MnmE [Elusimicrobiota bacterium]